MDDLRLKFEYYIRGKIFNSSLELVFNKKEDLKITSLKLLRT